MLQVQFTRKSEVVLGMRQLNRMRVQVDVLDYQLLYSSFFTDSTVRSLNTPDPSTGLLGAVPAAEPASFSPLTPGLPGHSFCACASGRARHSDLPIGGTGLVFITGFPHALHQFVPPSGSRQLCWLWTEPGLGTRSGPCATPSEHRRHSRCYTVVPHHLDTLPQGCCGCWPA